MTMKLREYNPEDYGRVIALWQDCGFDLEEELESPDGLARTVARNPGLFLVLADGNEIIGTVMGTYDGRRGWIHHLAVASARRGQGLGRLLLGELERRFAARGIGKAVLFVEPHNREVIGFYERMGYGGYEGLILMRKPLRVNER